MKSPIQRQMELFSAALEHPAGPERDAFLANACAGDDTLLASVRTLLAGHSQAGAFLAQPAGPVGPRGTQVVVLTEKPGDKIGRYKLLQQIGEGGCGTVYMAEQEEPVRRRVALKVIRLGMDTKSVIARFEAERQALALMDHPNIAKVFDGGATDSGRPYFVMELVRGIKITDYCDQAQLSTGERLQLFIQVCQAVQHAHQKGIIHRDIKPSNILVTVNDGVAVPKVIDFGIAKATDQRLTDKSYFTEFQAFIGTPAYTSPEQAEMSSLDIDTRSDIYSLGVLLYELLTGQTPFPSERLMQSGLDEMRRIIREEEPQRPSARLTTLPLADASELSRKRQLKIPALASSVQGDLDWIVMKALEKDRSRRYATSLDFAADLQRHLGNEAVLARPPSLTYKFQRTVRRNKGAFAAAAALFFTLLTGLSLTAWQAVRATREQTRAEEAVALARQESAAAQTARRESERLFTEAEKGRYFINMNQVQRAWNRNDMMLVNQLLAQTASSPERGFEWYYWQRETHRDLKTIRGPTNEVWSAAFSPDIRRVATCHEDSSVIVWDAQTGKEHLTLRGHTNAVVDIEYSPDGRRIISCGDDRTVRVWDAVTGEALLHLDGGSDRLNAVTFSPDGLTIAAATERSIKLWDASNGRELPRLRGHSDPVYSVAYQSAGRTLATGGSNGLVQLWDIATAEKLVAMNMPGDRVYVRALGFSPDGRRIATGSDDGLAIVWDAITGKELLALQGHSFGIDSVAFSRDGRRIVTGSIDKSVRVWDATSGKEILKLRGHSGYLIQVAFSQDGRRVFSFSEDGALKTWDVEQADPWAASKRHSTAITAVSYSPDGRNLVTGSEDGSAKIWDSSSGREIYSLRGGSRPVRTVTLSPDGNTVLVIGDDGLSKTWNVRTGAEQTPNKSRFGHWTSFSPDGSRIYSCYGAHASIFDAATGKSLEWGRSLVNQYPIKFSADGRWIILGPFGDKTTTRIWDATLDKEHLDIPTRGEVYRADFSPDGRQIVTGGYTGIYPSPNVWSTINGEHLFTLWGHTNLVNCISYSPDGKRILTATFTDGEAILWDAATGRELLTLPRQSAGQINAVAFSPDGLKIAAGTADGTLEVWEAASAEQVDRWRNTESTGRQNNR